MNKVQCFGRKYNGSYHVCMHCDSNISCKIVTSKNKKEAAQENLRRRIDEYKEYPERIIRQFELCDYENIEGRLVNNVAFLALKEMIAEKRLHSGSSLHIMSCNPVERNWQQEYFAKMLDAKPTEEYLTKVMGVLGPSQVKTYEEEKEMKRDLVRIASVTFDVNAVQNRCDGKEYTYLCPYDVKKGDIVIVDTQYGPSLAKVKRTDWDVASAYGCGYKHVLSEAINIKDLTCLSRIAMGNLIVKAAEISELEDEIYHLECKISSAVGARDSVQKDINKFECERDRNHSKLIALKKLR